MSPEELDDDQIDDGPTPDQDSSMPLDEEVVGESDDAEEADVQPLDLTIDVASPSACERHVTVTVAAADVDRYRDKTISEMMPTAAVPGFRPGRAPRKLVEHRFHKDVDEKVKGSLLMDSMTQVSEEQHFAAISEPDFDLEAVEIPDEGPMTFEFDIEVRPEFDLPEWKGLLVRRPVREFDDRDVERRLQAILAPHGELVPCEGGAQAGDYITVNITVEHDGAEVTTAREQVIRVADQLSFQDGKIDGFATLVAGAKPGETRQTEMELTTDAANEALRGAKVTIRFEILDVKQLRLPELNPQFLAEMGDFDSEEELRTAVRRDLERKLAYHQSQQIRRQITAALTAAADWDLPPGLLERQSARELERTKMELQRSGFSEAEIRQRENVLRQNSKAATARSLKEHFILERIAEDVEIDATEGDFDQEIQLLSLQSGDSVRRVRAQLEKRGLMDVLRNQIIERKVIDLVRSQARFQDEPFAQDETDVDAIDLAAGGGRLEPAIPEATQGSVEA
jgi:trigger factor